MPRQIDEGKVFEAVVELWVRDGYAGMTTKALAERAGVNEATLFRRYGDKAGVFVTAVQRLVRHVPLGALTPTDDLEADLVRVVEAYLETFRRVGAVFPLLLVEVARNPELRPALDAAWHNIGALTAIVAHHQASGALRAGEPLVVVSALVGPLFAVGLFRNALPDLAVEIDAIEHVRRFLRGWTVDVATSGER